MRTPPQTIVTVDGRRGRYSLHGHNIDGTVTIYGPVVEDHDRPGRWIGDTSRVCGSHVVGLDQVHCETEKLW